MGMFDYVIMDAIPCPVCGELIDGFQSKDGACGLEEVEVADVDNFYSYCEKCGLMVGFYKKDMSARMDGGL